ncbi:phage tail protein [Pleionea sp. CnH1-48]|uniref:phage tail protein n=1 Tax=Pleionea sp. CnH1-48 TaxID=2954494 RepID=UPI002096A328|nr:tail fiber protein [Pleionea sp. CnH1-48]MCO7227296.1 tail fiber protein [Pleionea sp. CnH1-48]
MSDAYIGEIRMFAGNFAPRSWALCDGQIMAISQNDALFSLLGTTYGGDGRTSFALPDLRGRVPINYGTGPGLQPYGLGQQYGVERVTLATSQIPSHNHPMQAALNDVSSPNPSSQILGQTPADFYHEYEQGRESEFSEHAVQNTGASQAHSNLMPSLCVNFIIALFGLYPPRS